MAQFSKTWWGKRFIEALEDFTDSNRLGRGRSYARNGKIKQYQILDNQIIAQVRGSVNPYFGVYPEVSEVASQVSLPAIFLGKCQKSKALNSRITKIPKAKSTTF